MFSIRNAMSVGIVCLLVTLSFGTGCQRSFQLDSGKLNQRALIVDNAMKERRWSQTTVEYANGGVPAWSTGMKYESAPDMEWWQYQIAAPATFITQLVAMPVVVISDRPNKLRTYRGVVIRPTWHAMPPLDPVQ